MNIHPLHSSMRCLALALTTLPIGAQQVLGLPDDVASSGAALSRVPFGAAQSGGATTYALRIPGEFLDPEQPLLSDFAFAASADGTWSSDSLTIRLAHLPEHAAFEFEPGNPRPQSLTTLLASLTTTTLFDAAGHGGFGYTFRADAWSPLMLPQQGAIPFLWNGRNDVAVLMTFADSRHVGGGVFRTSGSTPRAMLETGGVTTALDGLKVRVQCGPRTDAARFQTNSRGARLSVRGIEQTAHDNVAVHVAIDEEFELSIGSDLQGASWALALGSAPLVSAGSGALVLTDGQIFNLDLTDPSFGIVEGAGPVQSQTLTFRMPFATATSAQLLVFDPGMPSGLRLSQPLRLVVEPAPIGARISSVTAPSTVFEGDRIVVDGSGFEPHRTCVFFGPDLAVGLDTIGTDRRIETFVSTPAHDGIVPLTLATGVGNRLPNMTSQTSSGTTLRVLGGGSLHAAVETTVDVALRLDASSVMVAAPICFTIDGNKLRVDAPPLPKGGRAQVHIHFQCADGKWFDFDFEVSASGGAATADEIAQLIRDYINRVVPGATATGTGDDVLVCKDGAASIGARSFGKVYL